MNEIKLGEPKNKAFIDRFKQNARLSVSDKDFQKEITLVRENWQIPIHGFNSYKETTFIDWINKHRDNKFKDLSNIFKNVKKIECKPQYFLNKITYHLDNTGDTDDYPTNLYFFENIDTFNALVNEQPFPGIVHYILFNKVFIPDNSGLLLTTDKKYSYPTLVFGPNATARDLQDLSPLINSMQKILLSGYQKDKIRFKKNIKAILAVKKKPTMGGYDIMDELNISELNTRSEKRNEIKNKYLSHARQVKKRAKSL